MKKIYIAISFLLLLTAGFFSTYYHTYSEVYRSENANFGPVESVKGTDIYISIQNTREGYAETFFRNEHRAPYRVGFVFKGKQEANNKVKINAVDIVDTLKNRYNIMQEGKALEEEFHLWPNGTWGTYFSTHETFSPEFSKNPIIMVQANCTLYIDGYEFNIIVKETFKSEIEEQFGYAALDFFGAIFGFL